MDRSSLKKYAPQARRDFIAAVTDRAGQYGLTKKKSEPVTFQGDVALISGRPIPAKVGRLQQRLAERIARDGFDAVMEAAAYTWFNRFVAIRYLELHGYLDHGYRVLSHPEGKAVPELLEQAEHVALPGLNRDRVIDLKLAGDRDNELYRLLLVAQCNALHTAMPFLFERIDDETELLLPENLLHSDSLIRKLVNDIPEENWQEIEVIGWLYQFYISEKKDEVIGKVVKTEDIPAATQLFTPNWIVKYLVQNSIGKEWLATYPDSPLRQQMEYYIEPAEQTAEVQEQLKAITPESLNPEEMTLLDPACGSGHILVEAYDIFKAIYQERGYRMKDIPRLILGNNLFGLEIDERAAQLASFALIMKARADDRNVLQGGIRMNIRCIQPSDGIKAEEVYEALTGVDVVDKSGLPPAEDFFEEDTAPLLAHLRNQSTVESGNAGTDPSHSVRLRQSPHSSSPTTIDYRLTTTLQDLRQLLSLFHGDDAQTFGSLIRVPGELAKLLAGIVERTDQLIHGDDLSRQRVAQRFTPIAEQALIMARQYDAVVTNPPYIGGKGQNPKLKTFLKEAYTDVKSDVFSAFMVRNCELAKAGGQLGFMSPFVWMFISSYEKLRDFFICQKTITSLIQLEYSGFDGATVPICTFTLENSHNPAFKGGYIKLSDFRGAENQAPKTLEAIANPNCGWFHRAAAQDFKKIPGSPIAYWVKGTELFSQSRIGEYFVSGGRNKTHNNERYLRFFWEVSCRQGHWNLYANGGEFRKYYGNEIHVINWSEKARQEYDSHGGLCNKKFWNKEGITWSLITSARSSFRIKRAVLQYSSGSPTIFRSNFSIDRKALAFLNTPISHYYLKAFNPTLNTTVNDIFALPYIVEILPHSIEIDTNKLVQISKDDWDFYETSWDFTRLPLLHPDHHHPKLSETYARLRAQWIEMTLEMQRLEEENNRLFIEAYGLQEELTPEVPLEEITLTCNPYYRFKAGGRGQGTGDREEEGEEEVVSRESLVVSEEELVASGQSLVVSGEEKVKGFPVNQALEAKLLTETTKELVSYAVGCMMGRYSLDEPGLIYAHSGNAGFDPSRYTTFPADEDGIVPLTEYAWFEDDIMARFVAFIATAWPKEHLEDNLEFIADSLGRKKGEASRDIIRRYFATGFFKDHLQTYKRRPIYWLFTSGKLRAFQCLVYLHRYNEGTLARMRTEYVIPLQGKMATRMEHLAGDIVAANTTSQRTRLERERDTLRKQLDELRAFDETLRHFADLRIALDLDDGVKVNYGKFGTLLAEADKIRG